MLVVNPKATTTTATTRDRLVGVLKANFDLSITVTDRRGHAERIANDAALAGFDFVVTFGGDGTVSEVVNGILASGLSAGELPVVCPLPGGSANVFCRSLGFSNSPTRAIGQIVSAVEAGEVKLINLGKVRSIDRNRFFTFSLGMGIDAEVIKAMESSRASGKRATPARYLALALRVLAETDDDRPKIKLTKDDGSTLEGALSVIVQNTNPWTFFGPVAMTISGSASFDRGLDYLAMNELGVFNALGLATRMMRKSSMNSLPSVEVGHDQTQLLLQADRPMPVQLDGESFGAAQELAIDSVPHILPVVHRAG